MYIGHFPKRYSKQKRINVTFECRWHVLHFLLVAGPQLNAVVLQGSARFAQGFDSSARQVPDFGKPGAKSCASFAQARASSCASSAFQSHHVPMRHHMSFLTLNTTLSYSFSGQLLFFSSLSSDSSTSCTSSSKVHRASDIDWFWDKRRTAYHFVLMRHMHQKCIE